VNPQPPRSSGVFKPTGHTVIAFPFAGQAQTAAQRLQTIGGDAEARQHVTDEEVPGHQGACPLQTGPGSAASIWRIE